VGKSLAARIRKRGMNGIGQSIRRKPDLNNDEMLDMLDIVREGFSGFRIFVCFEWEIFRDNRVYNISILIENFFICALAILYIL